MYPNPLKRVGLGSPLEHARIFRTGDLSPSEKATLRSLVVSATPPPMDEGTTTPPLEGNDPDS